MAWLSYSIGGAITAEAAEELQEILNDSFGGSEASCDDVADALAKGRSIEVSGHNPDEDALDDFIERHGLCFHSTEDDDEQGGEGYWRKPDGTTGKFDCNSEGRPLVDADDLRKALKKGQTLAEVVAGIDEHLGGWMPPMTLTTVHPPMPGSTAFAEAMAAALDTPASA